MELFYSIETGEFITEEQIFQEYQHEKKSGRIDYDFPHYIDNCHYRNNGTLCTFRERVNELKKRLDKMFPIVDAETAEEARDVCSELLNAYIFEMQNRREK